MYHGIPQNPRRRGVVRHFPRRLAAALLTTVIVLVFLLRFDPGLNPVTTTLAAAVGTPSSNGSSSATGNGSSGGSVAVVPEPSSTATESGSTPAPTQSAASADVVLTGSAVATPYGTVQVQVTLEGTTIVDVTALDLPSGGRDSQISGYAEPRLRSEALSAQSANIDTVSGATYTSRGYIRSLQSALDQAA